MKFIELTTYGRIIFINPQHVVSIVEVENHDGEFKYTDVRTTAGYESVVRVDQSAEWVRDAVEEAVNEQIG